jgi:hypothetical protein
MRLLIESLLLAALAILTIAKPIPMSDDEIQRRWHSGESEVCLCLSSMPGCYVLAWVRSLAGKRVCSS